MDEVPPTTSRTASRAVWVQFGAATLLIALVIWPLWRSLVVAAVLVAVLQPLYERLTTVWGGRRTLTAALFTLGMVLLILLPLAGLLTVAVREAIGAAGVVSDTISSRGVAGLVEKLPAPLSGWIHDLQRLLPGQIHKLQAEIGAGGRWALATVSGTLNALGHFAFQLIMMLIAFFFLLRDGRRLVAWLLRTLPLPADRLRAVLDQLQEVARSVLGANFITSAAQAVVATIGFFIARAPSPIFFGLATLITSMIPSVGSALVTLPVAGLLLLTGHGWAALFLAAWAVLVVGLIDNFLRPVLIKGGAANLHGALVFFSLLGAIAAFGAVGLFLGPLVLTFFLAAARQIAPAATPARAPAPDG
jgi:predicted PurR-regulated permease PerM